jgi:ABC-2 type transport system ATP-binding protein
MIEVKELSKRYDHVLAVDGISFAIEKGDIVGFLGPNGAGKTTTLRILTGYLSSTSGVCTVAGYDVSESPVEAKRRIGYLPEDNPLYEEMKVYEYLEFVGRLREVALQSRIPDAASVCGIEGVMGQNIGTLSKGYRQRVGLASSILHDPEILLLDEPTSGLDPNQVMEVRELIQRLGREKTVMISTHILREVEAVCDRVLIINNGRIVADGKKDELQTLKKGKELVSLSLKAPREAALEAMKAWSVTVKDSRGDVVDYKIEAESDIREELFTMAKERDWVLLELHREVASLEDVFRELTLEQ